jgi:hypothetical protein
VHAEEDSSSSVGKCVVVLGDKTVSGSFIDLLPILGMGGEHQGLTAMPRLEDYGM